MAYRVEITVTECFPDTVVSSSPDRFPHYIWTTAQSTHSNFVGSRVYVCHCSNTGVEQTPNKNQHTKLTLKKKIFPLLLPGFELMVFPSRVWHSTNKLSRLWYSSEYTTPCTELRTLEAPQKYSLFIRHLMSLEATAFRRTNQWKVPTSGTCQCPKYLFLSGDVFRCKHCRRYPTTLEKLSGTRSPWE